MNKIICVLVFFIGIGFGFLMCNLMNNNVTDWETDYLICNDRLTESYLALNSSARNLLDCRIYKDSISSALNHCEKNLTDCINEDCNCTVLNTTKYSFGCDDIKVNEQVKNEYTKYKCYWDLRERDYPNGRYYSPCTVCSLQVGRWHDHCDCADLMPEICTSTFVDEKYNIPYWENR